MTLMLCNRLHPRPAGQSQAVEVARFEGKQALWCVTLDNDWNLSFPTWVFLPATPARGKGGDHKMGPILHACRGHETRRGKGIRRNPLPF